MLPCPARRIRAWSGPRGEPSSAAKGRLALSRDNCPFRLPFEEEPFVPLRLQPDQGQGPGEFLSTGVVLRSRVLPLLGQQQPIEAHVE